jgi:hypothetical protein
MVRRHLIHHIGDKVHHRAKTAAEERTKLINPTSLNVMV